MTQPAVPGAPGLPDDAVFRANPGYELVLYDRLAESERQRLGDLEHAPDLYGVLRPHNGRLSAKSVSREAALLFLTLREPGPLPAYLGHALGAEAERLVAALVYDEVLEVQVDGRYVSGTLAHAICGPSAVEEPAGRLARLSLDALRYAAGLPLDDPRVLAERIYGYNRLPLTRRWTEVLGDPDAVAAALDLPEPNRGWRRLDAPSPWHAWARDAPDAGAPSHKLYVSPTPDWIGPTLRAAVEVLSGSAALGFKVGSTAEGLLRPDKLVAYFPGRTAVDEAASELRARLSGVPAHGVPFTAALVDDGLLSWGMDPPDGHELSPWRRQSWRLWLAGRLATALLQARHDSTIVEPWRYALDRVRLEGVDVATWAPAAVSWAAR